MYRQGDLLIVPVAEEAVPATEAAAPREPRDRRGRLVLAFGEATGHAHAVVGPGTLSRGSGAGAGSSRGRRAGPRTGRPPEARSGSRCSG